MIVDKDAKVLFQSLVCTFGLSVGLGVISCADVLRDSQGAAEFSGECGCEMGVLIRNDTCGKSIMWEYVSSVKFSCAFGVDGFIAGNKNGCFQESVCDRKYGIVRFGKGKFDDEVHGYGGKGCFVSV